MSDSLSGRRRLVKYLHIAIASIFLTLVSTASAPAQEQQPQASKAIKVEPFIVEKFVKYAIIAVDQANLTGNYTVLHAMGTPAFKKASSASQLSKAFESMRKANIDLSAILLYRPKLSSELVVRNGVMHATGYFPTEPMKVNFDVVIVVTRKGMMIHGLKIHPSKDIVSAKPAADAKVDKPAADAN
jgi:hypothetical protein